MDLANTVKPVLLTFRHAGTRRKVEEHLATTAFDVLSIADDIDANRNRLAEAGRSFAVEQNAADWACVRPTSGHEPALDAGLGPERL